MNKELEEKYARMWHDANDWKVPVGLEPWNRSDINSRVDRELYVEGIWKVLNMLAEDGLISEETLRRLHEENRGERPGWSRISIREKK